MNGQPGVILNSHTVQFQRLLPGSIERAWQHITGPKEIAGWLFADSSFDLYKGGRVELKFATPDPANNHLYCVRGTISEFDHQKAIAYSWIETSTDLTSSVRFTLEPQGQNVLLTITHSYVSPEFMPKVGAGWHAHLDTLIALLKGEQPTEFLPSYNSLLLKYSAAVAAALVVSSTVSPAIASSNDPGHKALNAQRQQLLAKYDSAWKDADGIKYQIDQLRKGSGNDMSGAQDQLQRDLNRKQDDLHRIELDIRDLDKALI
jgi:uncharacterized protein YndB with AHSA1/START domain